MSEFAVKGGPCHDAQERFYRYGVEAAAGVPLPGLKVARVRRRLTVEGLPERAGLHRDTVNRLKNLSRGADPVTLGVLAGTLGVSEAELTGEEPGA